MVSQATPKQEDLLAGVDIDSIDSGKAFDRQERQQIVEVVELEVVAADEDWMERRRMDFRSPEHQAMFPAGFPVLKIGLKGIDVRFAFSADDINRIYVPIRNEVGHNNAGKTKGRGSQLNIVTDAFKQVYGVSPLGTDNQAKILAAGPARWGQWLGKQDVQGESQPREWQWDIPKQLLGRDFKYTGEVRVLEGRAADAGAGGASVGATQMSEADSDAAVAQALVGLATTDFAAHNEAVLKLKGLSGNWYDEATGGNVAQAAATKGLIVPDGDVIALAPES